MNHTSTLYSREDNLLYKNGSFNIKGLNIADRELFYKLSRDVIKGLGKGNTKLGKKAGKRTKNRQKQDIIRKPTNLLAAPIDRKCQQSKFLPTILYTNCRSLNVWKLAELNSYAEIHKTDIICLTETWFDAQKQQLISIEGYDNQFSNRKNRIGGGVRILTSSDLNASCLSTYTTRTISAAWFLVKIASHKPLIIGCVYHPPNADHTTSIEYIEETISKLTPKHPEFMSAVWPKRFGKLNNEGGCQT